MSDSSDPGRRPGGQRRMPRNRALALFIGIVLLILVVVFGYMLLVGGSS